MESDIETKVKDFSTRVSVTNTPFIIYISGIDTYGSITTVSRSDVNMIVTVNPNTKKILLTSIPRDYYVTLANMKKKDKLTHSGIDGPENTVKTMAQFLGQISTTMQELTLHHWSQWLMHWVVLLLMLIEILVRVVIPIN